MVKSSDWRFKNEPEKRRASAGQIHPGIQIGGSAAGQRRASGAGDGQNILGVPVQTLGNWVRLNEKGQLKGAGDKPVSAEQMELARLRAQLARVTMERDILKKATAYFAKESL